MSRRKRRKKEKSRKKLVYGIIVVVFILLCFVTYFFLHQPNQTDESNDNQFFYKAAIVDHLSFREETKNETFKNSSIDILETAGFDVTYYPGKSVTIDFYQNLVRSRHYGLIVFRVHSAIIFGLGDNTSLCFFTSELENESYYDSNSPYFDDFAYRRIVRGYFSEDPTTYYFAVAAGFIKRYGDFQNTIIIIMGCDGLKYSVMAEAFKINGAKVCIGWTGLVSAPHTDRATQRLLQHLTERNSVEEAVDKTMDELDPDQEYDSLLTYYPENAGSYIIQFTLGISDMETLRTNTVLAKEESRLNWIKHVSFFYMTENMEA